MLQNPLPILPPDAELRVHRPPAAANGASKRVGMFSQTSEYALRAMMALVSNDGRPASSAQIAVSTKVPKHYLSKVLRDLVVAGLVDSQRGPTGGFVLGRSAESISILDIINAVDPLKRITACPLGRPDHVQLCPLHRELDAAIAHVEQTLGATRLIDLKDSTVAPTAAAADVELP
jgi:Rrf2 family protein